MCHGGRIVFHVKRRPALDRIVQLVFPDGTTRSEAWRKVGARAYVPDEVLKAWKRGEVEILENGRELVLVPIGRSRVCLLKEMVTS